MYVHCFNYLQTKNENAHRTNTMVEHCISLNCTNSKDDTVKGHQLYCHVHTKQHATHVCPCYHDASDVKYTKENMNFRLNALSTFRKQQAIDLARRKKQTIRRVSDEVHYIKDNNPNTLYEYHGYITRIQTMDVGIISIDWTDIYNLSVTWTKLPDTTFKICSADMLKTDIGYIWKHLLYARSNSLPTSG
jgi:hypothetical protein